MIQLECKGLLKEVKRFGIAFSPMESVISFPYTPGEYEYALAECGVSGSRCWSPQVKNKAGGLHGRQVH
jgi:hypothetical protein